MSYHLEPIPAFNDNYIWCLSNSEGKALVVDPGDAAPVLQHLDEKKLELTGIFLTHHHFDHSGGIARLRERFPVPVHGPAESPREEITERLEDDDTADWDQLSFRVIAVPGHTLDHIAFFCADEKLEQALLFCGDTLFVGGCGRLFEGTPVQMQKSLARLRSLPEETLVCCAHEYTLANLAFARAVMPDNQELVAFEQECQQQREAGHPTVPGRMGQENTINPFLRWDCAEVIESAQGYADTHGLQIDPKHPDTVFAVTRLWKDQFKG